MTDRPKRHQAPPPPPEPNVGISSKRNSHTDPWTRKVTSGGGAADTALIIVAFAAAAVFLALR